MTSPRSALSRISRLTTVLTGGFSLLFLTGCSPVEYIRQVFSMSGPMSTMVTAGPVAERQWDLFMITVWVCLFIFIVVGAVLAYAQVKFRARSEADEHAEPPAEAGHGNPLVEIGLIAGSVILLVIIAIPTVRDIWYTHDVPDEEKGSAMDVTATGYQWWFQFKYDKDMIQLPNNGGEAPLTTGNELVVPVGTPVRVHLRTIDVIHSFWIPKLAGKVDMMPNRANFLWFKADKAGYYYGQCAEYCGESHAIMKFRVIALSPGDYVKWLDNQKQSARNVTAKSLAAEASVPHVKFASFETKPGSTYAGSPAFDADPFAAWKKMQAPEAGENVQLVAAGRKLFNDKTCVTCHTVRGHEGVGITGPDLTHIGSRSSIAAGVLENTPERLHDWIKRPDYFKPGNKMYHGGYIDVQSSQPKFTLTDPEIDALVAYLHSLK